MAPLLLHTLALATFFGSVFAQRSNLTSNTTFAWENVEPSETLDNWVPCFGEYKCARFSVPLNWNERNSSDRVAIALTKLPANVSESSPEWKGPLFINPGGPGASGVAFALSPSATYIREVVGADYTIIGFDPRGVNNTMPVTCFHNQLERSLWTLYTAPAITNQTVGEQYALYQALGPACEPLAIKSGAEYVNTPSVAQDMLAMNDASWKAATCPNPSEKGLSYWGFSYGTALGMTFATMFPDRVERLAVDGVVDLKDYYAGTWRSSMADNAKALDRFFEDCSHAGAVQCPFHGNESATAIKRHLEALLRTLEKEPLPYQSPASGRPGVITSSNIAVLVYQALYTPITSFTVLAEALAALEAGNATAVVPYLTISSDTVTCDVDSNEPNTSTLESMWAIACGDAPVAENELTLEGFKDYLEFVQSQTPLLYGAWAQFPIGCQGWKVRPKGLVHNGTWGATTKEKLLYVGNTADPVTPLDGAKRSASLFPGSGMVTLNTPGHTSLAATSLCVAHVVRDYFREGTLPANGTFCEPDELPFGPSPTNDTVVEKRYANVQADLKLRTAAKRAAGAWAKIV